jgi:hypothetical protein
LRSWFSRLRWRGPAIPLALKETTSRVALRNDTQRALRLIFEPWCQKYELPPGAKYVFEATSPLPGWLTVEPRENEITVYAWDGCVARVRDGEGRVIDLIDVRVPDFSAPSQASEHSKSNTS